MIMCSYFQLFGTVDLDKDGVVTRKEITEAPNEASSTCTVHFILVCHTTFCDTCFIPFYFELKLA